MPAVGLAGPNYHLRAAGRGVGAHPLRPGGPHKDSSGAPNVAKWSRQDAGVGLAAPNGDVRAAGRGVGAKLGRRRAPAGAHAHTEGSAGMDAGGALARSRDYGARRMRAAGALFRGPEGRLKQACQRLERQQGETALSRARQDAKRRETQDAGVGLAGPNGHVRAAGRGVGAQPGRQS